MKNRAQPRCYYYTTPTTPTTTTTTTTSASTTYYYQCSADQELPEAQPVAQGPTVQIFPAFFSISLKYLRSAYKTNDIFL